MANEALKIPKTLKQVVLWVHPEGRVLGSIFLREQSMNHAGAEDPVEVINQKDAFLVIQRQNPDELRFYNRASIIRVEYEAEPARVLPEIKPLACQLHMMDGALITGTIKEPLPPDRSRLFDYLNRVDDRFIKLYMDEGTVYLVNKSYIIHATAPGEGVAPGA